MATVEDNDLECILFGGKTIFQSEELLKKHGEYGDYYRYKEACTDPMADADLLVLLNNVKEYRVMSCMQLAKTELIRNNKVDTFSPAIQRFFLCNPVYSYIKYFRVVVLAGGVPSLQFHLLCAFYAVLAVAVGGII